MDEDTPQAKPAETSKDTAMPEIVEARPEVAAYLTLLVVVYLLDQRERLGEVRRECKPRTHTQATALCQQAVSDVVRQNRRALDPIGAKLIFFLGRCKELGQEGLASMRDELLALQRTSALRHDAETNATVQNLLLRLFIVDGNQYDQADKLVARAPFPRTKATNPQVARYDYYVGRIRAVQLNYSDALSHLQQAIRRAPQQSQQKPGKPAQQDAKAADDAPKKPVAAGFLQTAYKFLVIVELLMGDLPERATFRIPVLRRALAPYLQIVQAVRVGDLSQFQTTLQRHRALFQRDKTYSLILRLRHNVIKTGIRRISLAYSRISLADITRKLHLESEEDAEYVIAKAIRDGVIDARVEHDSATMVSNEAVDIYATNDPQAQLQQRINFCIQLHNDSVKVSSRDRDTALTSRLCATRLTATAPSSLRQPQRASASANSQMRSPTGTWATRTTTGRNPVASIT